MASDDLRKRFERAGNEFVPSPGSLDAVKSRARKRTLRGRLGLGLAALLLIGGVAVGTTILLSDEAETGASESDAPFVSDGLVEAGDVAYVGSFELPESANEGEDFGFSEGAIAYNPAGEGSLFITGANPNQMVAEISIPVLRAHEGERGGLFPAEVIQPLTDITEGRGLELIGSRSVGGLDDFRIGGLEVIDGPDGPRLHWTAWQAQNEAPNDVPGHGHSSLDLSDPDVEGPWFLGEFSQLRTSGYLFDVPTGFADVALGGNSVVSGYQIGSASATSQGPSFFAFSPPDSLSALERLDVTELANFDFPDEQSASFAEDVEVTGADWITTSDNRHAVLVAGNMTRFGNNNNCGLGAEAEVDSTGPFMALYDPSDLAAVAAGLRLPSEVEPYEIFSIEDDVIAVCGEQISGISYDAANGRLFVAQIRVSANSNLFTARPVIHVFSVR